MEPIPASAAEQRLVRLLTALVALVAALLVALAVGAVVAWREYARLRSAVALAVGRDGSSAHDLLAGITQRREAMSGALAAAARDARAQIAQFEQRTARLREQGGGPIESAKRGLELSQLMSDEMLLQLKLMTTLDSVLEKAARPLAAERELLEDDGHVTDRATPRARAPAPSPSDGAGAARPSAGGGARAAPGGPTGAHGRNGAPPR